MPDRLTISLWLKVWDADRTLEAFHKLLKIFPYSKTKPRVQTVTVQPLEWGEPPSFEQHFAAGGSADECLEAVRQFQNADCAYQALVYWDVGGVPRPVTIIAYGPDFEGRDDEQGHIDLDLGLDDPYRASRENIVPIVFLMAELPKRLPLRKRVLWAESGEDVSELLTRSVQ
jgi:hypothetical protein